MTTIAITGGAGFIGSHLVEHVLKTTDWQILIIDRLTYASNGFDRLRDIKAFDDRRVRCFTADLTREFGAGLRQELGEPEYIVHMAAETHVDRSITDPWPFIQSNVIGTYHVLEWCRSLKKLSKLVYFSTDEVAGPAPDGVLHDEQAAPNPSNPYAAAKLGGEALCQAWANTYGVPAFITRTMNAIGERQASEKFVPMVVRRVLSGEQIAVHASPDLKKSGSRFYIHARNVAAAMLFLLERGQARDKYNIVGEREITNEQLVWLIGRMLEKTPNYVMIDAHSSRPGHDLRYGLDGAKLRDMGWSIPVPFEESLERTIRWMIDPAHAKWLEPTQVR